MNRCHDYDDQLDNPPPPPWWQGPLAFVAFVFGLPALIAFCTGCTCTLDGESVARAIVIYQTK